MVYPISVFLDSNIFIACKYNTSEDSQLGILLRHIQAGKIKLFLSDIVKREVEAHICKDVENAVSYFKKALKDTKKSISEKSLLKTSLCSYFDLPTEECIKHELITQFEQYLIESHATILDNCGVNIDSILDDYFSGIAPFETRNQKKHEFPDAIMAAKLKIEFPENQNLWIISNDEGFKNAFLSNSQFHCLSRLQDLYNFINKNDHTYEEIQKYFSSNADEILATILNELNELKFSNIEVDGTDYDRKGIIGGFEYNETYLLGTTNLKAKLDSVDEISENSAIVTAYCSAHFSVYGNYDDFNHGIWDSEDGDYIFLPHYDVYEEHDANFYCELKLNFKEKSPNYSFSIKSAKCDIKLDQYSRVARSIQDPYEDAEADQMDALEEYYEC